MAWGQVEKMMLAGAEVQPGAAVGLLADDPFKSVALPEVIEEYLDYAGTEDGYIIIWDFETRSMAKLLNGHSVQAVPDDQQQQQQRAAPLAAAVTSLAWARNGRLLLSGSLDKRVMLWDVAAGQLVQEVALSSGVTRVSLSPRKPYTAVASLISTPPVIIDLDKKEATPLASIDFKASAEKPGQQEMVSNHVAGMALLSKSGREVLLGQLRGTITLYDTASQQVLDVVKLPAAVKVMSMCLNRQGSLLLVNCSDKAVRLYEVRRRQPGATSYSSEQLKQALDGVEAGRVGSLLHSPETCMLAACPLTFQNAVEKNQWKGVVLSGDSEHVVGAVAHKTEHRVYIWSRLYGKLERILEGPRNENIADLAWHPTQSLLVTLSGNGKVYLWAQVFNENWSAFAPDFQELDENQEYVEAEDEFDINEKPAAPAADGDAAEDAEVDVITRERLLVFSSDEEDEGASEEPLHWLPAEVCLQGGPGGDQQPRDAAAQEQQEEGSDASSEGDAAAQQRAEELILDRPRDRKRRVRFEDSYATADSEDEEEEMQPAGLGGRGGRASGGRGRVSRRGRPPKYAGAGAAPGRGPPAGMYGAAAAAAAEFGGPGNVLNPAVQQQQQLGGGMYGMRQQWRGRARRLSGCPVLAWVTVGVSQGWTQQLVAPAV
ncbi:WD40-repeat-containing domain protein [Scenedesmus sp. NREL 46B-D3]|nr:WD40-repeat-containing domain protein [Scenedesmus sp. NREL 46B-D3]